MFFNIGLLSENVDTRFLYYVSDIPLDASTSLSTSMSAFEGIPPLYATTRCILDCIFKALDSDSSPFIEIKAELIESQTSLNLSGKTNRFNLINCSSHSPDEECLRVV